LGSSPGGWLQVAHQIVGNGGILLGVDKNPLEKLPFQNVKTIVADITDQAALLRIESAGPHKFDVVISDLAQNLSGVWEVDHARQIELARCAFRIARALLKPSGNFLVKVFQGSELNEFREQLRTHFHVLRIVKPPASRSESAELYFLGLGFLAGPHLDEGSQQLDAN
jgi:23S rRNA (uridine2552-2'-O)-methyltransferase